MYSPEIQQQINELRDKVARGEYTRGDCIKAVRILREGRETAVTQTAKAKAARAKSAPVDIDKLFKDLDSI
jgi:hypothetical protein